MTEYVVGLEVRLREGWWLIFPYFYVAIDTCSSALHQIHLEGNILSAVCPKFLIVNMLL
jgi:hypothetical protein